jgi:uncharacterized protein (TIGR03435 family)
MQERTMGTHFTGSGSARKIFLNAILAALTSLLCAAPSSAQSFAPDWQAAAGGHMAFDVATVKKNTTLPPSATNSFFPLGPGDVYVPTKGQFRAVNFPLLSYIEFAYKLTENQEQSLLSQLPKWATTDRYDIQGRAQGNPTKDQMRLMIQTVLEDRFRLAVHYELKQVPVLALIVAQPGNLGPLLRKHDDNAPCATTPWIPSPAPTASPQLLDTRFPGACGGSLGLPPSAPGRVRNGARNISMELIATSMMGADGVDRPVMDRTELSGTYDFALEYTPQRKASSPPGAASQRDAAGPTFIEALNQQLGLRLEPQMGIIDFFIVDHVEEPAPN